MRKNQVILRIAMAIAIAFGVQTTASAQLGGLLNKAKKAVKNQAESIVSSQKDKVKEKVNEAKAEAKDKVTNVATSAAGPELPEIMSLNHQGHNDDVLYEKLYSFRFATPEEAKDFKPMVVFPDTTTNKLI